MVEHRGIITSTSAPMKRAVSGGVVLLFLLTSAFTLSAFGEPSVHPERANAFSFPPCEARFVRLVVHSTNSGSQVCVDELEVYGPDSDTNLALAEQGAKASASSALTGYPIHQIEHLNDGEYGNARSWVAAGSGDEWAQIELPRASAVSKVVFSRDRHKAHRDRTPVSFEIQVSPDGSQWTTVKEVVSKVPPASGPGSIPSPPPPPRLTLVKAPEGDQPAGTDVRQKDELGFANLALDKRATARASSLLPNHAIHQVEHLNDGRTGNDYSWISERDPSWAEIDLGRVQWVYRVGLGSDATGGYTDRAATAFRILAATEYADQSDDAAWKEVCRYADADGVKLRQDFAFEPVEARWIRIDIQSANSRAARLDEIEVFGAEKAIERGAVAEIVLALGGGASGTAASMDSEVFKAFLGEEVAWLKTYGRADISPALVPYNGRVKEYPHHVGDDRLPLPELSAAPAVDGALDDGAWGGASQGIVRVGVHLDTLMPAPLIEHALAAGWHGENLYLRLKTDRLLSSHIAIVAASDWQGCGVVAYGEDGFTFSTYGKKDGKEGLIERRPIDGAFGDSTETCEFALPLEWFADCRESGIRVGLGMGGQHTSKQGRILEFVFDQLSVAQTGPCVAGAFPVRLAVPDGGAEVHVKANTPGLENGLTLTPGKAVEVSVPGQEGPIGPQFDLEIEREQGEKYALHLFRYDPAERALNLMEAMIGRFATKGLDVASARKAAQGLRARQTELLAQSEPDKQAERDLYVDARRAKRGLFFREPDLAPAGRVLFVKRRPFLPSHNYSVILDSPYRGGGAISVLDVPRRGDALAPEEAAVTDLFDAGEGIARTPMADFGLENIYFGYRPSKEGYYHVYAMGPDGSNLRQLTDGPFHDYWPCPLPDNGLAFISTRCKARFLCWRPQAAVMFRMDTDGGNIKPLSFANLTEWAPSVMSDGRIIWTRSEYVDKGADFGHTLWCIRPDGTKPELVFGNDIIQPNGYANGREVPGTNEFLCTLISHFGDLNGPLALVDIDKGRFSPGSITSLTPEVPWPGAPPREECFRDGMPLARDYFLCSHAPRQRFGLYIVDRFGNRELLYADPAISSMCPTLFRVQETPPALTGSMLEEDWGELTLTDVYQGLDPFVKRGQVKYIRVCEEVRANLEQLDDGQYRNDHEPFMHFYASPVDIVSGPNGWPTYVAKASHGIVPVEEDGSARFRAPAGKVLYFEALDENLNEIQRMRSVLQLQPGERRSCIGCHESRQMAPPNIRELFARTPRDPDRRPWEGQPLSYGEVVQPVLDAKCASCHDAKHPMGLDFRGVLDENRVPASYRTLITKGLVHYCDYGWNSGGCEKRDPLTFGTVKSKLWDVLNAGHKHVELTRDEMYRIKTWIDLNCPLWPDYVERTKRPMDTPKQVAKAE